MAITATVAAVASAGTAVYSAKKQKDARKDAERDAAKAATEAEAERKRLDAVSAAKTAATGGSGMAASRRVFAERSMAKRRSGLGRGGTVLQKSRSLG